MSGVSQGSVLAPYVHGLHQLYGESSYSLFAHNAKLLKVENKEDCHLLQVT